MNTQNISLIVFVCGALLMAGCSDSTKTIEPAPVSVKEPFQQLDTRRTYAMIKPDAVRARYTGKIIDMIENNGFTIVRMEKMQLTPEKAREFYAVHKDRPFYNDLVAFMTSGPIIALELEKDNAVKAWRDLMGATDPYKAADGTIRKAFGRSVTENAAHGSDAPETAAQEIAFIFSDVR